MEKLLWIDLEMTGLIPEKEVIIEVGAIVTDWNFKSLDEYSTAVKQPQSFLDGMDDWNKKHHGESGLISLIPNGKTPAQVDDDLFNFAKKHFAQDRPIIAGNSIAQDRRFIDLQLPKFASCLHYRMLDVTAWKVVLNAKFNTKFEKQNRHRAVDDIRESIEELKYYINWFQK